MSDQIKLAASIEHLAKTAVVARREKAAGLVKQAFNLDDVSNSIGELAATPWGMGLLGAGGGAALGGMHSLFSGKKRRQPFGDILTGALAGGSLGLGGKLLYDHLTPSGMNPVKAAPENGLPQKPVDDGTGGLLGLGNSLMRGLGYTADAMTDNYSAPAGAAAGLHSLWKSFTRPNPNATGPFSYFNRMPKFRPTATEIGAGASRLLKEYKDNVGGGKDPLGKFRQKIRQGLAENPSKWLKPKESWAPSRVREHADIVGAARTNAVDALNKGVKETPFWKARAGAKAVGSALGVALPLHWLANTVREKTWEDAVRERQAELLRK